MVILFFFTIFTAFTAPLKFNLKNSTGYEISEIYVSPSSSSDPGDDLLGGASLQDGKSFTVNINPPGGGKVLYDVLVFDIEDDLYSKFEIPITDGLVIEFTLDDLDEEYYDDED